jgi:spore maturation protein CgeB
MSYRLAVIAYLAYPDRITAIYRDSPGLAEQPWERQREVVADHPSMPALPFRRDFAALGLETEVFYPDAGALNQAWMRDRAVDFDWDGPPAQIRTATLLGQLAEFQPDAIYVHGLLGLHPDFYAAVKDAIPGLRALTGFEGMAVKKPYLRDLDELFVCVPPFADDARALGMEATVLYHAFDAAALKRPELSGPVVNPLDFTFIGSSGYGGEDFHSDRYWTLFELMVRAGLQGWINEPWLSPAAQRPSAAQDDAAEAVLRRVLAETSPEKATAAARLAAAKLTQRPPLPLARLFPDRCRDPVYGAPMLALLRRSKITFNMHAANAAGAVGNYRMFEATGVGACLLTDHGSNLATLFVPDKEVAVYRSPEEAVEKARYLLEHEDERRQIAAAGQARALSSHSFADRCARIDAAIRRRI